MKSRRTTKPIALSSGSPLEGEPVFLAIGKLRRPHGTRGEMLMEVYTDFPERLVPGAPVFLGPVHRLLHVRGQRPHREGLLITFVEIHNRDQAVELRNEVVYVRADDRPSLPGGEYYHHQILGLRVLSDQGHDLGIVTQILETGANDVCVVSHESSPDLLLPMIDSVILDINLEQGEMRVHLLPGLTV